MKDAGDKRPSRHRGHGAPTSPGEHREGLGFEACRWQTPTLAQTPARAFSRLWGNGSVGARHCSVPAPGAWPTALATACTRRPPCPARLPCPPLGSSLSARLPVCPSGVCLPAPLVLAWDSRRVRVHLLHVISDPCPWAGLTVCPSSPLPRRQAPVPRLEQTAGGGAGAVGAAAPAIQGVTGWGVGWGGQWTFVMKVWGVQG